MTRLRTALLAALLGAAALAAPAGAAPLPAPPQVKAEDRDVCVWITRDGSPVGYCLRF